ncbi:MAG: hypothetical protein ABIF18_00675 [archaeon]
MKKSWVIFGVIVLLSSSVLAAMDPNLKECIQRGYEIKSTPNQDTVCIFPDGSNCSINSFNQKSCGEEFMTEGYCVKQGDPVWDKNRCCSGLAPYPPKIIGMPTCQDSSKVLIWNLKYNPVYWFGIIIFLVLIGYIGYRIKNLKISK